MNAFFTSVEQLDNPTLRGKPVGVLPNGQGTLLIASSYEAKALNISTGCHRYEALKRCPNIHLVAARPQRYLEISKRIMHQLYCHVTDQLEIFSIDEAFLDVTRLQQSFSSPEALAIYIQRVVIRETGLPVSVGLSGDRTSAKWACKRFRPLGIGIIHPNDAPLLLSHVPIDELCGINSGVKRYLSRFQVITCEELANLPSSMLTARFGNTGTRLWLMAQGKDPEGLKKKQFPKSLGNSKVIPSHQRHDPHLQQWCLKLAHQLVARLTEKNLGCHYLVIAFSYGNDLRWKYQMSITTIDPIHWYRIILHAKSISPHQKDVTWMGLYAKSLYQGSIQDLWTVASETNLAKTLENIQTKWGRETIKPLSYLKQEQQWAPDALPAWCSRTIQTEPA